MFRSVAALVLVAVAISVAFAVMSFARGRVVAVAGVAGGLGWVVLAVGERALSLGSITSSAFAAALVGFAARVVAKRLGVSALAVTTAAIVPLLPGRLAYQGISQVVTTDTVPQDGSRELPNLVVRSVAPLFAETIHRIHHGESVSSLFSDVETYG